MRTSGLLETSGFCFMLASVATGAPINDDSVLIREPSGTLVNPDDYAHLVAPYINPSDVDAVLGSSAGAVPVQTSAPEPGNSTSLHEDAATQARRQTSPISAADSALIMQWVHHFDQAYGIPQKAWSTTLHANAQKTGNLNGGVNENHYLFPGTMAQVIVNGLDIGDFTGYSYAPFQHFQAAYLDWLCEVPSNPQLGGVCPQVLSVTCEDVAGQTGHHDILTSKIYTQIGCSFTYNPTYNPEFFTHGIWVCDLA